MRSFAAAGDERRWHWWQLELMGNMHIIFTLLQSDHHYQLPTLSSYQPDAIPATYQHVTLWNSS